MSRSLTSNENDIRVPIFLETNSSLPPEFRATIGSGQDVRPLSASQQNQYLIFKVGEDRNETLRIRTYKDSNVEYDESFRVKLGTPRTNGQNTVYGVIADGIGIGTIQDDDTPVNTTGQVYAYQAVAYNGLIDGGTAWFDANRNGTIDFLDLNGNGSQDAGEPVEPSTLTLADGSFTLAIPVEFDSNGNGSLDDDEGRLVVIGGINTGTLLPLETPLMAPLSASVVTPLTSIAVSMMEDLGLAAIDAQIAIRDYFELPASVNLFAIDAITETVAGNDEAARVVAANVQANDAAIQISRLLQAASGLDLDRAAGPVFTALAAEILNATEPNALHQPTVMKSLIDAVTVATATTVDEQTAAAVAEVIAAGNARLRALTPAGGLEFVASVKQIQAVALGNVAADIVQAASGVLSADQLALRHTGTALDDQIAVASVRDILPVRVSIADSDLAAASQTGMIRQRFGVALSEASARTVTVGYRTIDLDETGNNVPTAQGVIEFQPGDTQQEIEILVDAAAVTSGTVPYAVLLFDPVHAVIADAIGESRFDGEAQILSAILPGSAVPYQPVNLEIDFIDRPEQTHTAQVDWGDGTVEPAAIAVIDDVPRLTAAHTYLQTGTYQVSVLITDELNNVAQLARSINVSTMILTPDPSDPNKQWLTVGGTAGKDHIDFKLKEGGTVVEAKLNDSKLGQFARNQLSQLVAYGGHGDDHIKLHGPIDIPAQLFGGPGDDHITGGRGNDRIDGQQGDDRLQGDGGDDQIRGGGGNDLILGEQGSDLLKGNAGNDLLIGGDGDDHIKGGPGNDLILGQQGNDRLKGNDGDDLLIGGDGDDQIDGGDGDDFLLGGPGDDVLDGGSGNNLMLGGSGSDVFPYDQWQSGRAAEGELSTPVVSRLSSSAGHDVNGDGRTTALDALVIINSLARQQQQPAVVAAERDLRFDVNHDDRVTALDALLVINGMRRATLDANDMLGRRPSVDWMRYLPPIAAGDERTATLQAVADELAFAIAQLADDDDDDDDETLAVDRVIADDDLLLGIKP